MKKKEGVSKFLGENKNIFLLVTIIIILASVSIFLMGNLSGKSILDINFDYVEGSPLEGALKLSIQEGELIPADSKLIFENGGSVYEFVLNDVLDDEVLFGDFYVEGTGISGNGSGYGLEGIGRIYPEVNFTLVVKSESTSSGEGIISEPSEVCQTVCIVPRVCENITNIECDDVGVCEDIIQEVCEDGEEECSEVCLVPEELFDISFNLLDGALDDSSKLASQVSLENFGTKNALIELTYIILDSQGNKIYEEKEIVLVETEEVVLRNYENLNLEDGKYTFVLKTLYGLNVEDVFSQEFEVKSTLVFWESIRVGLNNFFKRITGRITLGIEEEIDGTASKNVPYSFTILEGQVVEIKTGSVISGSKTLSDGEVDINVVGNEVTVSANYFEEISGFGNSYLGEGTKELNIDLGSFNLILERGNLIVRLVYGETELINLQADLVTGEIEVEEPAVPEVVIPEEIVSGINESPILFAYNISLNEEDYDSEVKDKLALLSDEFGENVSIKVVSEEVVGDRIVIKYELNEYWVIFSYDSGISEIELDTMIKMDRVKWVGDLINELTRQKTRRESISTLDKEYPMRQQAIIYMENFE